MTTFAPRQNKDSKKASLYFSKMRADLDIEKYQLAKYQDLFLLSSFKAMHDADLAYHHIYDKCAENSKTKEHLLDCLQQEEKFSSKHPKAFDADNYRRHTLNAITEIRNQLSSGAFDHLYQ
jgi:hypothetical protein